MYPIKFVARHKYIDLITFPFVYRHIAFVLCIRQVRPNHMSINVLTNNIEYIYRILDMQYD